jgi:hypothetical protein
VRQPLTQRYGWRGDDGASRPRPARFLKTWQVSFAHAAIAQFEAAGACAVRQPLTQRNGWRDGVFLNDEILDATRLLR